MPTFCYACNGRHAATYLPVAQFHGGQTGYKDYNNSGQRALESLRSGDPLLKQLRADLLEYLRTEDISGTSGKQLQEQAFIRGWLYCCRMKDERASRHDGELNANT